MTINNIQASDSYVINTTADTQAKNTDKLASGYKVNRNDDAATLSIKSNRSTVSSENTLAASSSVADVDKVDEMISQARANILSQPEDALKAQANQGAADAMSLMQ